MAAKFTSELTLRTTCLFSPLAAPCWLVASSEGLGPPVSTPANLSFLRLLLVACLQPREAGMISIVLRKFDGGGFRSSRVARGTSA